MRHTDHTVDGQHERDPSPGVVQLRGAHDLIEHGVDLVRVNQGQHDLLLRLDRHAEDLLLLVDARATPEEDRSAACAGFHGRLQHAAAPTLANDAHDKRSVHVHDSFGRPRQRTRSPSIITEMMGASAMSATSPSPCRSGSRPSTAEAAPSASASRNVLARGPVATPPESTAIATNSRSLSQIIAMTSTYPGTRIHSSGMSYAIRSIPTPTATATP